MMNVVECGESMNKDLFFQAEDGIRDSPVTGVQTCALPILLEDQIWDAENWQFAERYVPYLKAVDKFLASKE